MNHSTNFTKTKYSEKLKIVLFLVLLFSFPSIYAQKDLITTQAGEGIRCKILDETPNRFVYAYLSKNGKVLRNEIFKNLVTEFKYNYYQNDLVDSKGKLLPNSNVLSQSSESNNKVSQTETTRKSSTGQSTTTTATNRTQTTSSGNDSKKVGTTTQGTKQTTGATSAAPRTSSTTNSSVVTSGSSSKTTTTARTGSTSVQRSQSTQQTSTSKPSAKVEQPVVEKETVKAPVVEEKKTDSSSMPNPENSLNRNSTKFRVGVRGGFASLLKKTSLTDEYSKYKQGLESGWLFGIDAAYFPVQNFGVGAMYSNFQSKNSSNSIKYSSIIDVTKTDVTGAISDKTSTKFIGPVFYYRKNIDYKTFLILGVSPGMNYYTDKRTEGTTSLDRKAQQFGGAATLGVDFLLGNDIIGRDIMLSLEGGYNYAKFDKMDSGKGAVALTTPLDQSHWSVTIGLRFSRYPKYLRLTSY